MRRLVLASKCILISLLAGGLLSGCAGGGPGTGVGTGTLKVKVNWAGGQAGNKLIPASTQCLRLEVFAYSAPAPSPGKSKPKPYDTVLVPRQAGDTTTTTLTVPVGKYTIVAAAHANTDASDFPQAIGTTTVLTVPLNATVDCSLTLLGTVTAIELSPSSVTITGGIGATGTINVTATDSEGNVILLSPGAGSWDISPSNLIAIDAAGNVTSLSGSGYPQVTYTDSEHGVTSNQIMVMLY